MSRSIVSFLLIIFGIGCNSSPVINPVADNVQTFDARPAAVAGSTPLIVVPAIKLTKREQGVLDSSLPPGVRKILESASEFSLAGEILHTDRGVEYPVKEGFKPNTIANISSGEIRKQILESFYADVSKGETPSNCWLPHHKLTAQIGNELVEIEICFQCTRFHGVGPSGKFSGTFAHGDEPKSERLFNEILISQGKSVQ